MRKLLLLFALGGVGCLPGDTRPEPGSVLTTVSGSEATRSGFVTADGWTVAFDRALLCAGPMQLGDDCQKYAEYSEPGYDRILDLTGPPAQKLGIMFGLGQCDIDFQLSPPSEDAVLGTAVMPADKDYMRTPGTDAFVSNDGVVLHVEGSASDGSQVLVFAWDIRQSLYFLGCSVTIDGVYQPGLDLRSGQESAYDLLIELEGLFRDTSDRSVATLRFAPFAEADVLGDSDGIITLEELGAVPMGSGTLAEHVYRVLWPTLLRYRDTGTCTVSFYED